MKSQSVRPAAKTSKSTAPLKKSAPSAKSSSKSSAPVSKGSAVKPAAKVAPKSAPKVAAKAPVKAASKAPAKAPLKAVVKTSAKTPVKAVAKVQPKPAAKVAPKAAAKVAHKAPAKAPIKAPAKAPAKAPVKVAAKSGAKAPVKTPAKSTVKAAVKAAAKTAQKSPVKAPVKGVAKVAPKVAAPSAKPAAKTHSHLAPKVPEPAKPSTNPLSMSTKVVAGQSIAQPQNKKSSRGAKAASMVPPPPVAVLSNNAAKSSFGPNDAPSLPSVITVNPKKDSKLANNWKQKSVNELTDAEILAMPDSEYMNDTQMAFFRLKLSALKQDILNSAGQTTENLREETVVVPDPADRATIEEEHALELRTRDRERKLLKKIEQSIQRIDAGDYGYCDETGEAIGVGRLLARPTATLSLEAQQRRELKQKMFGD